MKIEAANTATTPVASPAVTAAPKATAARFEGLFVREMLKSMRVAKLDDGLLDSEADAYWADMRDQLFADTLAARAPLGVAATLPAAARPTPCSPVATLAGVSTR